MIFPYSGILYFVMNYRIKGTIVSFLLIYYVTILMLSQIFTPLQNEIMTSLLIVYNVLAVSL